VYCSFFLLLLPWAQPHAPHAYKQKGQGSKPAAVDVRVVRAVRMMVVVRVPGVLRVQAVRVPLVLSSKLRVSRTWHKSVRLYVIHCRNIYKT
jgi:hypothetical protein